jgi:hypothetical protein
MGAPEILDHLAAVGVRLTRRGDTIIASPKVAVTPDLIDLIRENKPVLMEALAAAETRRQRAIGLLEANPDARYGVVTDLEAVSGHVLLTLAIKGKGTIELVIPAEKWDGTLFLDLLERHGGTEQ